MVISIFLNIGTVKFLKTLHTIFIVSIQIFQIKILYEINFLLIIIYMLLQFKISVYSPLNFEGLLTYINALPVVYWPPKCIAIDHSSIGLKRLTIQSMFNEVWLCVWTRILRHKTSEVCTATLRRGYLADFKNCFSALKFMKSSNMAGVEVFCGAQIQLRLWKWAFQNILPHLGAETSWV